MTLHRIIRWITGPQRRVRARLEEQRMYDQLVEQMRNSWHVVQTHQTRCFYDAAHTHFAGELIIVAEENELHERRVRATSCPPLFRPEQSREWGNYHVWALRAQPIRPARVPLELPL